MSWLLYLVPWWAWAALGAALVLAAFRIVGKPGAIAAAIAIVAFLAQRKGAEQGWKDREAKGLRDANRAIEKAARARADADRNNAVPKRLRRDDGWRRD